VIASEEQHCDEGCAIPYVLVDGTLDRRRSGLSVTAASRACHECRGARQDCRCEPFDQEDLQGGLPFAGSGLLNSPRSDECRSGREEQQDQRLRKGVDLGPDSYAARNNPERKARHHIREVQALGYSVTLIPAA